MIPVTGYTHGRLSRFAFAIKASIKFQAKRQDFLIIHIANSVDLSLLYGNIKLSKKMI